MVLEVVDRRPPGALFVVSGLGRRSAWFGNVLVDPLVRVGTGVGGLRPATARELTPAEARHTLARYAMAHPTVWRQLQPILEAAGGTRLADAGTGLPVVEFRLHARSAGAGSSLGRQP